MRGSLVLPLGAFLALLASAMGAPPELAAQHDVEMRGRMYGTRPPPGYYDVIARDPTAYEFKTALIPWARRIMERRRQAMAAMDLNFLNGHLRGGGGAAAGAALAAVSGTIRIPSIIFKFSNTTNPSLPDSAALAAKLYSTPTPPTYSAKSLYSEMSRGMLTLDGDIFGPYTVTMPDTFYEGSCNGLPGSCGNENLGALLIEVLDSAEAAGVDFSPYDFDSDGQVDFVAFLHPELGGECGTSNIWAHRFVLSASSVNGAAYTTNDGKTIDDYIIQSAVGGSTACADSTAVMPIGTFSHETGHAFDLPDLYDTSGSTDGIGHWGLMGAGNWNVQDSPAHMSAWSLLTLGWVAVDTLQPGTGVRSLTIRPIFDSDTAWAVCTASTPANCLTQEYFLLANRAKKGSDVNVKVPVTDGAGLLIWHVDPPRIAARTPTNSVNVGSIPGLALEQADGLNELHTGNFGRGDTGDPWPGSTAATTFGSTTTPNSKLNDGTESNVFIDSITVKPDSSITLAISTGVPHVVTTNREGVTVVTIDAVSDTAPVTAIWGVGTSHTIAAPDTQVAAAGNERYVFQSWSDVAPPTNSHLVTATDVIPDTFTATLSRQTRLDATTTAGGSVSADIGGPITLPYWADTADVATVTATADVNGLFDAFTGDTTSANTVLVLNMNRPWSVVANFLTPVVITSTTLAPATMGFSGYADTLDAAGGNGTFTWAITGGALPQGMVLDSATGQVSGIPEVTGTFSFVAQATSTGLNVSRTGGDTVQITVNAPTLALAGVVDELLGSAPVLSQDELRYLDLLGNGNGRYDVGDFRAYLLDTGQLSAVVTAKAAEEEAEGASPGADKSKPETENQPNKDEQPQRRSRKEGV